MRMRHVPIALLALVAVPSVGGAQDARQRIEWNRPQAPFTIIGNVHYVGTAGLSAFLVTGPSGHVLIDGGLPESAARIAANVEALGYHLRDVRYILLNHSHYDHAGGLAELQRRTGATVIASAADARDLRAGRTHGRADLDGFPPVPVGRVIRDGERVTVGSVTLTAILTPGHTAGATSWTTRAAGKRVIFASSLTVAGQPLTGDPAYPSAATDFRATFARLARTPADVFLNFHPEFFDMAAKRAAQAGGKRDAFVDAGELPRQVARARAAFDAELARQTGGQ